jgi:hypothetical protein
MTGTSRQEGARLFLDITPLSDAEVSNTEGETNLILEEGRNYCTAYQDCGVNTALGQQR